MFSQFEYEPVHEDADEKLEPQARRASCLDFTKTVLVVVLCFIASFAGCLAALQIVESHAASPTSQLFPLRNVQTSFKYNRNFSDKPSNHTNAAWRSLMPVRGGFFTNPEYAPNRSTFSVFHQLHCLDGLRYGYHMNREAALSGNKLNEETVPWDLQPRHMRHCIDLLRQALMCNADTTIEVVDPDVNGVHGFRTPHRCKDWEQLIEWTNTQQIRDHTPASLPQNSGAHEQ